MGASPARLLREDGRRKEGVAAADDRGVDQPDRSVGGGRREAPARPSLRRGNHELLVIDHGARWPNHGVVRAPCERRREHRRQDRESARPRLVRARRSRTRRVLIIRRHTGTCWATAGWPRAAASVAGVMGLEVALGFERGHAACAGGRDRLAVGEVGDVAGREAAGPGGPRGRSSISILTSAGYAQRAGDHTGTPLRAGNLCVGTASAAAVIPSEREPNGAHARRRRIQAEPTSDTATTPRITSRMRLTRAHSSPRMASLSTKPIPPAPTMPSTVDSRMLISQRKTVTPANTGR